MKKKNKNTERLTQNKEGWEMQSKEEIKEIQEVERGKRTNGIRKLLRSEMKEKL